MSLDARLLENLANWRPDNGRQTLQVADGGWTAAVTADCADVIGCRIWELSLGNIHPSAVADLKARAEQVCARVTGLLEPLRLVEVDAVQNVALLRSEQPGQLGEERFYYEVRLANDGSSVVRRFQAPRAAQPHRQQVAFALTHDALAKLVRDLSL